MKILEKLSEVSAELEQDMNETGWTGRTVTLKYKLDTYQGELHFNSRVRELTCLAVFTRAKALDHWVSKKDELFSVGTQFR